MMKELKTLLILVLFIGTLSLYVWLFYWLADRYPVMVRSVLELIGAFWIARRLIIGTEHLFDRFHGAG